MMKTPRLTVALPVALMLSIALPSVLSAQFGLRKKIGGLSGALERMTDGAERCHYKDEKCINKANKKNKPVVLVDDRGQDITDENGEPISDPAEAAFRISLRARARPAGPRTR